MRTATTMTGVLVTSLLIAAPSFAQEADARQRDREIDRNYDEALRILRSVLKDERSELEAARERLQQLSELVRSKQARRQALEGQHRQLEVTSFHRRLDLERRFQTGALSSQAYQRLLSEENQRFEQKQAVIKSRLDFALKEENRARAELAELRAKMRLLNLLPAQPSPQGCRWTARDQASLRDRIRSLGHFRPKASLGDDRSRGSR